MSIKSILVPVMGYEKSEAGLVAALKLGRAFGATVTLLHVSPDPRDAVPLVTEGAGGVILGGLIARAEAEAKAQASRAETLYRAALAKMKVGGRGKGKLRYVTKVGRAPSEIAFGLRTCDLAIFARQPEAGQLEWRLAVEAALMESGRPLLLLPLRPREIAGKTVALAWNGSVEAARAASAALPFLARARKILLLVGERADEPVDPPPIAIADLLACHGVKAKPKTVRLKAWPVVKSLVEEAAAAGADLLAMGAYGHSRMRETVFGGATRAVIEDAKLPVLLAH
jgi:nucleotide-binding universal stress UspA family protein